MPWTRKCTGIISDGLKRRTNILTIGDIRGKGDGKYTGWNCLTRCWKKSITLMRNGSSASLRAGRRDGGKLNETPFLSDANRGSLVETHSCLGRNDLPAHRLRADSKEAG